MQLCYSVATFDAMYTDEGRFSGNIWVVEHLSHISILHNHSAGAGLKQSTSAARHACLV